MFTLHRFSGGGSTGFCTLTRYLLLFNPLPVRCVYMYVVLIGHCIFVNKKHQFIIGGDLLFQSSVGRTDLPLSSPSAMEKSVQELYAIPGLNDDCLVIPGHGEKTTLGTEREQNMYVQMWVK